MAGQRHPHRSSTPHPLTPGARTGRRTRLLRAPLIERGPHRRAPLITGRVSGQRHKRVYAGLHRVEHGVRDLLGGQPQLIATDVVMPAARLICPGHNAAFLSR